MSEVSEQRSRTMRAIRSWNTGPETLLRSLLHKAGYRFRLHSKALPGKPDIVFAGRRKAIFVHGCFWHQHADCRAGHLPASRLEYWGPKLERNKTRDKENLRALKQIGWDVKVVWECELIRNPSRALRQVANFLEEKVRVKSARRQG